MHDRKKNKVVPDQVKTDDLMALVYYVKVKQVRNNGEILVVGDVDHGGADITVQGKELIEGSYSADYFAEEEKVTMTQAAEVLVGSANRPLTVCFIKTDGTERTLKGRLVRPEPLLGRSMVEDLTLAPTDLNRLRQVDHRTIKFIVIDGVKFVVKK
jgi:hypothetical protein